MKEDKNIDKIIRESLDSEKVSIDFSGNVMEKIFELESNKEKALSTLLQKHTSESPVTDFTDKVMKQIIKEESPVFVYQPVLGKKVWFSLVVIIGLIIIYSFTALDYNTTQVDYIGKFIAKFNHNYSFQLPQFIISPIFALGLFALSFFLGIDYFIQNRGNSHKSNVV